MPVLVFGIVDQPYENENPPKAPKNPKVRKGKRNRRSDFIGGEVMTTGDVAEILEAKYHVYEIFFTVHEAEIANLMAEAYAGALEGVFSGAPATIDPFDSAAALIYTMFQTFIDQKEMDRLGYPGVPTKASLKGVSHRFKKKVSKPGRPSFQDTGLYETNFIAWLKGKIT